MKKALLFRPLPKGRVQCELCFRKCIIPPGQVGFCGVRKNIGGVLYSLVYGKACALGVDPIEKKPLFHFLPGSSALSLATVGCNLTCLHCQNADISQAPRETGEIIGRDFEPEKIVSIAKRQNIPIIAYTYTEPTVFLEYALDIMKLAKNAGIYNVWVTNGFFSSKALDLISPFLDAANVDLKFFDDSLYQKVCGAPLKYVLENLISLKKRKIHLEVTTLVIPGYTTKKDQPRKIARFIARNLSKDTPWHITAFYPAYKMRSVRPTSPQEIEKIYEIGEKEGLEYIYKGNLSQEENTYCPKCGALVISRFNYQVTRFDKNGKCPKCGYQLPGIY